MGKCLVNIRTKILKLDKFLSQPAIIRLKLTIETLEQGMNYVQS